MAKLVSQWIAAAAVLLPGLGFQPAWADSASDVCAALANARTALYSMINAKDVSTQDALKAKVQDASTKLDSVLAGMIGADAKVAADFKAVWDQFKTTRDNQLGSKLIKFFHCDNTILIRFWTRAGDREQEPILAER